MTKPTDDLPRSPTGRVPQWVLDEAAGRPTAPPPWRTPTTLTPARGAGVRRRSDRRGLVGLLVAVTVLGGLGVAYHRHPEEVREVWEAAQAAVPSAPVDLPAAPVVPAAPQLPPMEQREYPAPGFEEAAAPLGVAPVPAVTGAQYAFSHTQTAPDGTTGPVAWSPCRPIHYVIDPTDAPVGFAAQVTAVVAEVSAATGLRFVDDGATLEPPNIDRVPFQPHTYGDRWAPVLLRFADQTTVGLLAGTVAGVANPIRTTDHTTGAMHLVSGAVYLDTDLLTYPDVQRGPAYVPVLRHELGHLVGLDHVQDASQVMHPTTSDVVTFQPGDAAGLAALGRGACAPGL